MTEETPLLEVRTIGKRFGSVHALRNVSCEIRASEVLCVLGDNGAGKSTFIKILAGAHRHNDGTLRILGKERTLSSPREALDLGIATVYQGLATVPLMSVWRNFFLGSELSKGRRPFRRLDLKAMREIARRELADMGIYLRDVDQPIGTLSGGERQSVAIARAIYLGARVLILDEPTSALGVKQASIVLRQIAHARDRGLGVVFISHNPQHAYAVGNGFLILRHGTSMGYFTKDEITIDAMTRLMAGGEEFEALAAELQSAATDDRADG
ncbi:ATP-binding cassette domain-containing protein [Sphaerimonospora sp. CA-214678]|uniref:ATP-binding cassette domain-containing protein n=1 Tax=Sphaerimonospora sp. CA-214678 TaxID=3240029 RepID=UPI003D8FA729